MLEQSSLKVGSNEDFSSSILMPMGPGMILILSERYMIDTDKENRKWNLLI